MATTTIRVDSELLQQIESVKPAFLSTTAYFQLLAQQALTGGSTMGKPLAKLAEREVLPLNKEEEVKNSQVKKAPAQSKILDPALLEFEALIHEFWKAKGGGKGETSWKLLMTGLKAIKELDGDGAVEAQLEEGINGKWKGITLRNYLQFKDKGKPKPWQQEQANNHPASRVFTADDFDVPRTNPLMEELL